jgi:rare lipoprotein A
MLEVLVLMLISQQPVMPSAEGIASYYTVHSSSHQTASGERLDDTEFTCAANFGEFGDRVLVVSDSGRTVICRINDRGPFTRGRVVDLSEAAMRTLDPGLGRGLLRVKVYLLGDEPVPALAAPN